MINENIAIAIASILIAIVVVGSVVGLWYACKKWEDR